MLYFIIGYPYSGKSSFGKEIEKNCIMTVIDLDTYIEKRTGRKINDVFEIDGEKGFREIEREQLHHLVDDYQNKNFTFDMMIICGGGTPTYSDNLIYMKDNGLVIYFQVSFKTIWNRFLEDKSKRPRFDRYNSVDIPLIDYMENDLKEREEKYYKKANIIINYEEGINIEWAKFKPAWSKRTRHIWD